MTCQTSHEDSAIEIACSHLEISLDNVIDALPLGEGWFQVSLFDDDGLESVANVNPQSGEVSC